MSADVIGSSIVAILGFSMIFFPSLFVNFFSTIARLNYEFGLNEKGKPRSAYGERVFKILGLNKKNLSEPQTKTQRWLVRILGIVMFIFLIIGHLPRI